MSKNLSYTDVKRIRNAMQSIGTSAFATHFRRLLSAKLKFDTFLIIRFDLKAAPTMQSAWLRPETIPESALVEYCDRTYLFDPFFQFRAFPPSGAVYQLSEITPDRFFSSEYYLEYYSKTGLCDEIGLLAPLPHGSVAHLSVSRLGQNGVYKRREIQCLKHHAPILLEFLTQHLAIVQEKHGHAAHRNQFNPLSNIIRAQTLELYNVQLTAREAEIAALVLQGHSNRSAALTLGIARETGKVHRRNLYHKLSISSQGELFALLTHLL